MKFSVSILGLKFVFLAIATVSASVEEDLQLVLSPDITASSGCWRDAFSRGLGQLASVCRNGTELSGGLCYERCREGYRGVGPMCRHIKDDLEQYYRGVGKPASCDPESQYSELTGVWCFRHCLHDYQGVGPLCLALNCPASRPFPCGPGLCMQSFQQCTSEAISYLRSLAAQLLAYPMCRRVADGDETLFENMNMAVMKAQENVA